MCRACSQQRNYPYILSVLVRGLVASIFFDFFRVFLAMLSPSLDLPGWASLPYMQNGRQSPQAKGGRPTRAFC
jgi:hypothetical protein